MQPRGRDNETMRIYLSQNQLAAELGVHPGTVAERILRGELKQDATDLFGNLILFDKAKVEKIRELFPARPTADLVA